MTLKFKTKKKSDEIFPELDCAKQLNWTGLSREYLNKPTSSPPVVIERFFEKKRNFFHASIISYFYVFQILYQTVTGLKKDLSGAQEVRNIPIIDVNNSCIPLVTQIPIYVTVLHLRVLEV